MLMGYYWDINGYQRVMGVKPHKSMILWDATVYSADNGTAWSRDIR